MKRVTNLGQPGSGKSTLARVLGDRTGLPVFHVDHIHWKPGWVQRDDAERADVLIVLDVGVWRRLWRVSSRFVRFYGKQRPDMAAGCPEGDWSELFDF